MSRNEVYSNTLTNNFQPSQNGWNRNVNLLNRNQYAVWFSDRCNYKCSYCCNNVPPKAPKSEIENNTQAFINLFNQVEPGVIMVSGGEPALWQDLPLLLEELPQHAWVILTNLSLLPEWFAHPNIKLLLPAYHEEFAKEERFTAHLKQLKEMGKRAHAKIIVKPGQEYHQIGLWEKWNGMGVPASLVPLEYTNYFKQEFLRDLISKYRTSCLYNSRFFRRNSPLNQVCVAGTSKSFQVNSDGKIVRCSTVFEGCGSDQSASIWQPAFNQESKLCTAESCYCEWQHWAQMAKANDNHIWNEYLETGVWTLPNEEELCQFITNMGWDVAGRNVEGSRASLFPLNKFSSSLQIQVQLQQQQFALEDKLKTQAVELKQVKAQLQEREAQQQQTQTDFEALKSELEQTKANLAQAQLELTQSQSMIKAMESSKLQKMRTFLMRFKKLIWLGN